MSELEVIKDMLEKGNLSTEQILKAHTKLLYSINDKVEELASAVTSMETIEIINGNSDGTPTKFDRKEFFQTLYNRTSPLKQMEKFNKKYDTIKKFVWTIATIAWFIISIFLYREVKMENQNLQKEIIETLKEIRR